MKLAKYISISFCLGLMLISCSKEVSSDLEVPYGTSILMRNGKILDYQINAGVIRSVNENLLWQSNFSGSYSLNTSDIESITITVDLSMNPKEMEESINNSNENWAGTIPSLNYGTIVDGHQSGYRYNLIQGTAFVNLINLDTIERTVNIRWGGSFIREETNGWNLDLPYRADMIGIIHDNY